MSTISIEGMEFFAYHGCFKEEQVIGTKFSIDLFMEVHVPVVASLSMLIVLFGLTAVLPIRVVLILVQARHCILEPVIDSRGIFLRPSVVHWLLT